MTQCINSSHQNNHQLFFWAALSAVAQLSCTLHWIMIKKGSPLSFSVSQHLFLLLRWVCQKRWWNAVCSSWAWLWTLSTVRIWCIVTLNLRTCSCSIVSADASNWLTLAWPDVWAAAWNVWVEPSHTRPQRCAAPAAPTASSWPRASMCGHLACWSSVCWREIFLGRLRCQWTPSTRSFVVGRKRVVLWEHTRPSGGASPMTPCACFKGC